MELPVDYRDLDWASRRDVRNEYARIQHGICHHCKRPLDGDPSEEVTAKEINWRLFPKNFLKYQVHLHHSHVTGFTIGAVHNRCNAVLWQYHGE